MVMFAQWSLLDNDVQQEFYQINFGGNLSHLNLHWKFILMESSWKGYSFLKTQFWYKFIVWLVLCWGGGGVKKSTACTWTGSSSLVHILVKHGNRFVMKGLKDIHWVNN